MKFKKSDIIGANRKLKWVFIFLCHVNLIFTIT
jgi:hypothetical protein